MLYKENSYFKKYCSKHKDLKRSITYLENICKNENYEFHVFGSILRRDFYYKQSDCDVIIACDNIDRTVAKFEYIIQNNKHIQLVDSDSKKMFSVKNIPKLNETCASAILLKVNINGIPFDINFLKKNDFKDPDCIDIHQSNNFIFLFCIAFIKFLYYKINIIPKSLYLSMKGFINKNFSFRRYTLIKR